MYKTFLVSYKILIVTVIINTKTQTHLFLFQVMWFENSLNFNEYNSNKCYNSNNKNKTWNNEGYYPYVQVSLLNNSHSGAYQSYHPIVTNNKF